MVVRYLARRTRDASLAEELAQETFARATRAALGFREGNVLGWLLAIARNVHLDYARRQRRVVAWDDALLVDADGANEFARTDDRSIDAAAVRSVLNDLSDGHRRLLELVYLDGFTPAEVAAMTGLSGGAVRMALMRAREQFRTRWENI